MRLSELRKVAVKKGVRIRFGLSNGMECVVNEWGVAQVPSLHAAPSFNLEDEAGRAQEFIVEPVPASAKEKDKIKPRRCTLAEMTALVAAGGPAALVHDEHDE